jgi:hypothetical protein
MVKFFKSFSLFAVNETANALPAGTKIYLPEATFLKYKKIIFIEVNIIPGKSLGIGLNDFTFTLVDDKNNFVMVNAPAANYNSGYNALNRRKILSFENINTSKSYFTFYDPVFTLNNSRGLWFNFCYQDIV